MSKSDSDEVFTIEYRHEIVVKFIKDLMEGNIKLAQPYNQESVSTYVDVYREITKDIKEYFSGKLKGREMEEIESRLFEWIAVMRSSNMIFEVTSQTKIQQEIDSLNKRIDSTNTLLLEILKELKREKN